MQMTAPYNGNKPNGWIDNWISQGQMFGGYGAGTPDIQNTLQGFKGGIYGSSSPDGTPWAIDPSNTAALDALITYALSGTVEDNRYNILGRDQLISNGKGPWKISADARTDFVPVYVIYTNNASLTEDSLSLAIDILPSTGGSNTGNPIATNILINAAITAGSFLGARIKASMDARGSSSTNNDPSQPGFDISVLVENKYQNFVNGDLLFTPDGFGSFAKNYSAPPYTLNGSALTLTATSIEQQADGSWLIVDNQGISRIWPKTVNNLTIQPIDPKTRQPVSSVSGSATIVAGHEVSTGTYDVFPDLKLTDQYDFRSQLQSALAYLQANRSSLEQLGVVFPDDFDRIVNNPGGAFSPRPGLNLPAIDFSGTFDDYLASQAWLIKLFAGPLNVSTVLNVWRGNYTEQINKAWSGNTGSLREDSLELAGLTSAQDIRTNIDKIADNYYANANKLGWFKAATYMDYLAIDKYEQDELSGQSQGAFGGMYNRNGWINYLYFTQALAQRLPTGIGANYNPGTETTTGNISTMLFQMPTAPVALANPDGTANQTYYNSAGWGGSGNQPNLSSALDAFFGNPYLTSKSAIDNNFKQWVEPGYQGDDFQERGPNSSRALADYLFSQNANALEDQGARDLTQGLLTPGTSSSAPASSDLFNHIFSVLWGGGNTSAPINWSRTAWTTAGGAADPTNTSNGYVMNKWNTAVLDNAMQKLDGWSNSNELLGNNTAYTGEVVPHSIALFNAALKVAGSSGSQSVGLQLVDQGQFNIQWGLFKLDASNLNPGDPIIGTVNGVAPSSAAYGQAVRDAVTNTQTGTSWIDDGGKGNNSRISFNLQAGATYGFALLVPSTPGGTSDTLLTSIAAANPGGKAHGALLPTAQLMSGLNLSLPGGASAATQTIGFEDQIGTPDWDFNDASFTLISGASILV